MRQPLPAAASLDADPARARVGQVAGLGTGDLALADKLQIDPPVSAALAAAMGKVFTCRPAPATPPSPPPSPAVRVGWHEGPTDGANGPDRDVTCPRSRRQTACV